MPTHGGRPAPRGAGRLPLACAPEELFGLLADEPYSFFLDSALADPRLGRASFMGSRPFLVFEARGRRWTVRAGAKVERGSGDPWLALRRRLALYALEPRRDAPPLLAGAVGYVAYEAGRLLEPLRAAARPERGLPDLCFAFYEAVLAADLPRREVRAADAGLRGPGGSLAARQAARAGALLAAAAAANGGARRRPPAAPFRLGGPLVSTLPREAYEQAVEAVRDSIARGEIYQANLTQRFAAPWAGDPYGLYLRLRAASPAPFGAYLNFGGVRVLSSSPERFLKVDGGRVETRPIKGTRPRGRDAAEDRALALELVRSPKDAAEHVMITDLERNDLGRVCETGSVRVAELAALEVFPQVFHLTSTVEGRLRRGLTAVDALRAAFPGGSITGAPKIRAEEILAGLEPGPRGVYTGALGYVSFSGPCDLAIAIRTITLLGRRLSFGVGGGVVADSDPAAEYEESLVKARGMLAALGAPAAVRAEARA